MEGFLQYNHLSELPKDIQMEVRDFIEFLLSKKFKSSSNNNKPKFGSAKGKIKISPDFDESLDDFKDYM
jgi:hypothetical protein